MKKIIILLAMAIVMLPAFAQAPGGGDQKGGSTGPSQIEIAATGIAEIYKKSLKLNREQYAKVKMIYQRFLTNQAYNNIPGIGCEKLEKNIKKVLTEEQFKQWREQDPNRPLTPEQKAEYKKKKKAAQFKSNPSKKGSAPKGGGMPGGGMGGGMPRGGMGGGMPGGGMGGGMMH